MMLSEVVRNHLLKDIKRPLNDDDLEIAIHVGWTARDKEIEKLKAENARYREALEFYANPDNWKKSNVDNASKIYGDDVEHIVGMLLHRGGKRAREALKGG